ncbi:hypothetical protein Tco_1371576 [Tanacetum coccineum]
MPTDPHHTPTIIQPSTSQPQLKQRSRRPKRKDTEFGKGATTATSLEAEQDSGNIIKTQSKATPNEVGSQGTTSGGGPRSARMISSDDASLGDQEDASKQGRKIDDIDKDVEITLVDETQGRYGDDLMFDTCVLDDEEVFAGQDMAEKEINVAEKEVSTADPVTTAGEVVTTASVEVSTASPTETTIADDLTLAQTLIEIRSAKPKVKGVVIGEQSESTTRTRPQQLPSKDKGKGIMEEPEKPTKKNDQIRHDEEVAQRLQAKESRRRADTREFKEAKDEEEVTIDAIPLASKIFSHMLKSFNREDLEDLYRLVKVKYESTSPVEDLDLLLWGDLKTMFEPHVKDTVWRNQQDYKVLDWKLYDL